MNRFPHRVANLDQSILRKPNIFNWMLHNIGEQEVYWDLEIDPGYDIDFVFLHKEDAARFVLTWLGS